MELNNLGSLITYKDGDDEHCLGYLFDFTGHGMFDPTLGKVEVSKEHADTHNALLDQALIEGLDKNCEIGQGGTFYLIDFKVKTFGGTTVSSEIDLRGNSITFTRLNKQYRGRLQKNADCFNFRRVK